jgi:hypothetical protein
LNKPFPTEFDRKKKTGVSRFFVLCRLGRDRGRRHCQKKMAAKVSNRLGLREVPWAFGTGVVPHFAADGIVAAQGRVSMGQVAGSLAHDRGRTIAKAKGAAPKKLGRAWT